MSLSNEQIVDAIAGKTLMEVMELVKAIEDKFGFSAAAPVAAAGRGADRVQRHPEVGRREEGRGHQGRPCHHRPGPEGSQGPHRGGWRGEGRRVEGRRREDEEGPRGRRRDRRSQVSGTCIAGHMAMHEGWGRKPPAFGRCTAGIGDLRLVIGKSFSAFSNHESRITNHGSTELTVGSSGRRRAGAGNTSDFQLAIFRSENIVSRDRGRAAHQQPSPRLLSKQQPRR